LTNKPKQRGTRSETMAVRYLVGQGFTHAIRRSQTGSKDSGDLLVTAKPRIIAEVKSRKGSVSKQMIDAWWTETEDEAVNANADLAVLIVHRSGISVADWQCWMPAGDWTELCHPHGLRRGFTGGPLLCAPLSEWAAAAHPWSIDSGRT
jgi:hypothetical protein